MIWLCLLTFVLPAQSPSTAGDKPHSPAVGPRTDSASVWGMPVLDVIIRAPAGEDLDFLRATIAIESGYLLDPDAVRTSLKRLFVIGRFSNVEVHSTVVNDTVLLRFTLHLIRRLEELHIDGLRLVHEGALRRHLRIFVGDEVGREAVNAVEQRAREFLRRAGFPEHRLTLKQERHEEGTTLLLTVEEGPAVRVGRISFSGQPGVVAEALRREMRLKPRSIFDQSVLQEDLKRLESAYRERGFWQIKIGDTRVQQEGRQRHLNIVVHAGRRFSVDIVGNRLFTDDTLMTLWPEKAQVWRATTGERFAEQIAARYLLEGYNDARATVHSVGPPGKSSERHFRITIDEGQPTRVRHISFPGAQAIPADQLRQQLLSTLETKLRRPDLIAHLHTAELRETSEGPTPWRVADSPLMVPLRERWVPAIYSDAIEDLRAIYQDRGYLDVRIGTATVEPVAGLPGDQIDIRIEVSEGPQTRLRAVRFVGNTVFPASELMQMFESITPANSDTPMALGGPLARSGIQETKVAISRRYANSGHIYSQVSSTENYSNDQKTAEVVFRLQPGPQVTIANVLVRGNRRTAEAVIRDRLLVRPHTVYDHELVVDSQRELHALGVFSDVRLNLIEPAKPAAFKDLVAEVTEHKRGRLAFGAGFSTADGFRLNGTYTRSNLFGHAWSGHATLAVNRQFLFGLYGEQGDAMRERYRQYLDGSLAKWFLQFEGVASAGLRTRRFRIPFDTVVNLTANLRRENALQYSLNELTLGIGANILPSEIFNISIEPRVALRELDCPKIRTEVSASEPDQQEIGCGTILRRTLRRSIDEGQQFSAELLGEITFDLTNHRFNPTSGIRGRLSGELVSGLSRDSNEPLFGPERRDDKRYSFLKGELVVAAYVPLGGAVWQLRGSVGSIDLLNDVPAPLNHRFLLGGPGSHRAFRSGVMIPEDGCISTATGPANCVPIEKDADGIAQTVGGHHFVLLRSDFNLPLGGPFILNVFADVGNLWFNAPRSLSARLGFGAGLHASTPIGPVALDFGRKAAVRSELGENEEFIINLSITSSGAL